MINRRQPFKVLIDGVETGAVKSDDSQEFLLEPGEHVLQVKVSWMSSAEIPINLQEGKNTYLKVRSGMKYYTALYFIMIAGLLFPIAIRLLKIPVTPAFDFVRIVLIFPAILYWLYYITINRKNYVVVEEDKSNPFA